MRALAVLPVLLGAGVLQAGPASRWFPLDPGNRWVYENQGGGVQGTFEIIVLGPRGDLIEVAFQHSRDEQGSPLVAFEKLLRESGARIEIQLPGSPELEPHYFFDEPKWIRRDLDACDDRREVSIVSRQAVVETPAGRFESALHLSFAPGQCADGGTEEEFFAPDVGLVKSTFQSFLGPRSWVLASFERLPLYTRGDANADGGVNISDAVYILAHLFTGGPGLECEQAGDANDDDAIDISDPLLVLNFLFLGAEPPPEPFAECGVDGFAGELTCASFAPCAG